MKKNRSMPGSRIGLTQDHKCFLLWLRFEDLFQTNDDYVDQFFFKFGIKLSQSFITRWFRDRFVTRGGLIAAEILSIDKFRPEHISCYDGFCVYVRDLEMYWFCFCNEKALKGAELFNVKGRADLFTGERPTHVVNSDFRNTYCVIGMCSISRRKSKAFVYTIGECTI